MLFIDESGSITKSKGRDNRYFIMSIVETENPLDVKRRFRHAKVNYIEHNPSMNYMDYSKEIKGSEMPLKMKKYIYGYLCQNTDVKFHYIVIDNWHLYSRFHNNVELCFNYVLCNYLKKLLKSDSHDSLKIVLDERNCKVASLNSLEDYLKIELCLRENLVQTFQGCGYSDSKDYDLLQVADLLANTVFRATKERSENGSNSILLKSLSANSGNMYFPYKYNSLSFFESDIFLTQ